MVSSLAYKYVVRNGRVINGELKGIWGGSGRGLIEVLFRSLEGIGKP